MKIKSIILRGFRCYRDEIRIPFDDFTAFIGKNDIGKSAILDALAVFFENPLVKLDRDDLSKGASEPLIVIGCEFEDLPDELVLDVSAQTTLQDEYLLNGARNLEIHKHYDFSAAKLKETVFAVAHHPANENLDDLLSLKNAGLKARLDEMNIPRDGVQLNSNPAIRAAIRSSVGAIELTETHLSLNEEDGKKIWKQIESWMPVFALFRADRPSSDQDAEVQDPMKTAVQQAVQEVEGELERIRGAVEDKVLEVARRTLGKLRDLDPSLANELRPRFGSEPNWAGFKLSLVGDNEIPINKRGSGVRRLVLLSFFQAEVERRRQDAQASAAIYALEEPEASQHPNNQKLLAEALLSLSAQDGCQVLITTHVPALADLIPVENLRHVHRTDTGENIVDVGTSPNVAQTIASSLGSLPNKDVKVLVYVEGPNDVRFLQHVSRTLSAQNDELPNLAEDPNVVIFPVAGANLRQWVDEDYFKRFNLPEVHIYDRGTQRPPRYESQVRDINARGTRDISFMTTRRELENYLHRDAINSALELSIERLESDSDVPSIVARAVHEADSSPDAIPWDELEDAKRKRKCVNAKKRLNDTAAAAMTAEQVAELDPDGEIEGWLNAISERI